MSRTPIIITSIIMISPPCVPYCKVSKIKSVLNSLVLTLRWYKDSNKKRKSAWKNPTFFSLFPYLYILWQACFTVYPCLWHAWPNAPNGLTQNFLPYVRVLLLKASKLFEAWRSRQQPRFAGQYDLRIISARFHALWYIYGIIQKILQQWIFLRKVLQINGVPIWPLCRRTIISPNCHAWINLTIKLSEIRHAF